MKRNSRLSLALHTLSHMASAPEHWQTSADIAAHAGTNPVVVRRVLGKLRQANLLESEKGHAKGWRLARAPNEITLADIYVALEESFIASDDSGVPPPCSVEHALQSHVSTILNDIENSLVERLANTTILDVLHLRK
ncbi:MAG: Rrf2 family transcriptional regulator [Pseudomonadota bacterium]